MSAVHSRWELAAPLLLAHPLRGARYFHHASTETRTAEDREELRSLRLLDDDAMDRGAAPRWLAAERALRGATPIAKRLVDASSEWLEFAGDHWSLAIDDQQPGREIVRWRSLTMLLPPTILSAAAAAAGGNRRALHVRALPPTTAPRDPVAHLHVHLGPLLPFEVLWGGLSDAMLLRGTLDGADDISARVKGDAIPELARSKDTRRPGLQWQWTLELAFLARVWMRQSGLPTPRALALLARGSVDASERRSALLAVHRNDRWRSALRRLGRPISLRAASGTRFEQVTPAHPADDEVCFLAEGFRRSASDAMFSRLFCQYLRIKVALYGRLVVDPWTSGLRHFLDVVRLDAPYSKVVDDSVRDHHFRVHFDDPPLRLQGLEVHQVPGKWLEQVSSKMAGHDWILSFVRAAEPDGTDDRRGADGCRHWRATVLGIESESRMIARCLERRPSLLRRTRGVGLMHWERNGPVWLFGRAMRALLDRSREVVASHPRMGLQPLRTAFHLGEDFHHILSGLRQIYEPLEWGLVRRGDRIGHALALGLAPEAWAREHPWVLMRPLDRLLDIGFIQWAVEGDRIALSDGVLTRLQASAAVCFQRMFGEAPPDCLRQSRDLWRALGARSGLSTPADVADKGLGLARERLLMLQDDRSLGRRALGETVEVETRHDVAFVSAVHDLVHRRVAAWDVAIEVNPSSNLLVGGFRSIFDQPIFHDSELPIIINADDPLTFGTTLSEEYAYAWAGMVCSGVAPHLANQRLEQAAQWSQRYRFSSPETLKDSAAGFQKGEASRRR